MIAQTIQDHHPHDRPSFDNPSSPASWRRTPSPVSNPRPSFQNDADTSSTVISPIMSRRASVDSSSDRYSTISGLTSHFPNNPTTVNPQPAYVAPFGASQVVSEDQSKRHPSSDTEDDDDKKSKDDVKFSGSALALVNAFLDQLLYSFLSTARSTSLLALRPAVTDVLKHRLAREAIASAEEELAELLAGGDDEEELESKHKSAENNRKWDLELVWKRTRLRVMVYMRLGEMEDEDEQRFVKEEELFQGSERRFSSSSGLVSWAAAIFLTSVLEYVAEQTLQVAGQAASSRARKGNRSQQVSGGTKAPASDELVVEEHDVEKVALNSLLGRLWRTWRKALRNNGMNTPTYRGSPSISRMSRMRENSTEESTPGDSRPMSRDQNDDPGMEYSEHVLAANIPLPLGDRDRDIDEIAIPWLARDPEDDDEEEGGSADGPYPVLLLAALLALPIGEEKRDVDEIEVPGLAKDPDAKEEESKLSQQPQRRNSFSGTRTGLPIADESTADKPVRTHVPATRQRSSSLPMPITVALVSDEEEQQTQDGEERPVAVRSPTPIEDEAQEEGEGSSQDPQTQEEAKSQDAGAAATNGSLKPAVEGEKGDVGGEDRKTSVPQRAPSARKKEYPWMATGVTLGALTAAAGTAAWADTAKEDPKSNNRLSIVESLAKRNSAIQAREPDKEATKSSLAVKDDVPQRRLSDKQIEELDKRKSLIDIKSMMVVNSPSSAGSGAETPQVPNSRSGSVKDLQRPPTAIRTGSFQSAGSNLDEKSRGAEALKEETTVEAIGVAKTSDARTPRSKNAPDTQVNGQQARDGTKRPARLNLQQPDKEPGQRTPSPRTPRQFLDLTEEKNSPEQSRDTAAVAGQPSPKKTTTPSGAPSAATSRQQSWTTAAEKPSSRPGSTPTSPSVHRKSGSEGQVQEHPVIQRMASLKNKEPKSPREADKAAPLTSAAIRGPEDFDMFVQGGDTVKYTLTPVSVRDEPTDGAVQYPRSRQAPAEMEGATETRAGRSQSIKQATSATNDDDRASKRRSISRPSARNTSAHRKSGLMAREPRVLTESTRDFADFIRSTGPGKEAAVYPILANASSTSLHSLRTAHINGAVNSRSSSPSGERSRPKSSVEDVNVPPVPPIPGKAKSNMQARAATTKGGGSSDLIDFIRSGPEEEGQHRISRSVAPFRTTMDSDQLRDLGDLPGSGRPSNSTLNGNGESSSKRTSVNSRSALLNGAGPSNPGPSNPRTSQNFSNGAKPAPVPDKKRYRNKDPYAIDFSDDEDDLLTALPKATRQEESLADFLNNNEPPQDNAPKPIVSPNSVQARNALSNMRANSIRSAGSATTSNARTKAMPNTGGPQVKDYASTVASRQAQISNSVSAPGTPKKRMEARGSGSDNKAQSSTKDLANFLKDSGPPDEAAGAPAPSVGRSKLSAKDEEKARKKAEKKKSTSGVGAFFSRSRKKTYLDMP